MPKRVLDNYNKEDKIATGVYRPKTTSLFFDKLWLPDSLFFWGFDINCDEIPSELCIKLVFEKEPGKSNLTKQKVFRKTDYNEKKLKTKGFLDFKNTSFNYSSEFPIHHLKNSPFLNRHGEKEYLLSANRNKNLEYLSVFCKLVYGVDIVPVYLDYTEFETSIITHDYERANRILKEYTASTGKEPPQIKMPELSELENNRSVSAYEACIKNIPMIVEENLDWKQVLEIRKDKSSIEKIKRFRYWVDLQLEGKSKNEIKEILDQSLDEYKFALKKHGVMTAIGGFTTVLSSASTIISAVMNDFSGIISASFVVTAGITTYTSEQISSYIQTKREPIAFIYDIMKKSKND